MIELIVGIAIGAAVGGLALALFVARRFDQTIRRLYCIAVVGQLDIARRVSAGQSEELVQQIVDSIPHYVGVVNAFSQDSARADAVYAARRFYEATNRTIPENIRETIQSSPARAVVCYKLQTLCSTDTKCIPIPTSLRPVSNTEERRGWEKGETLCGLKKGWIFYDACGAPLTIGSCI